MRQVAVQGDHVGPQLGAQIDRPAFYAQLSGRRNLQLLAAVQEAPADQAQALLEEVGLSEAADEKAGGYSTGMQQRLGLAAALLGDPALLILDEPTTGLDPDGRESILNLIRRLHRQGRYKLAVLSNAPPNLAQWLADWKILDLFDVVFCSGDEGVTKPDPAAFEITLERLGVAPEEAVFIDDTLGHVKAAQSLGIHGLLFTTAEALADRLNVVL